MAGSRCALSIEPRRIIRAAFLASASLHELSDFLSRHRRAETAAYRPRAARCERPSAGFVEISHGKFESCPVRFECYCFAMSAIDVIEEIKHLSSAEQSRVIQFAYELARERQLSGDKLGELARCMVEAKDPAEADRLQKEIVRGFYGDEPHA